MSGPAMSWFTAWSVAVVVSVLLGDSAGLRAQDLKNLAAAQEGGRVVFFSSQYDGTEWRADHLIDGSANKGWAGQSSGSQWVVIGFRNDGLAEIHDVLINPYTREDPSMWAKAIEIQVSATYPFRDFRSVGTLTLKNEGKDQVFSLPQPTQARYVKVRFLSNHGGAYMEAGEIQVMGKLLAQAPPAPGYMNVAAAAKGAKIEKFTSQYDESTWAVTNLLGDDSNPQWAGKSAASQEVVIALPEVTPITDVSITNYSKESPNTWAKEVEVEVSSTFAYKGFTPIGKISMPQVADLHTITLPAPVPAKYVRIFFRSNHGGAYMEAARVRVFKTDAGPGLALGQQLAETGRAVVREIRFATKSAEILPGSEAVLTQIVKALQDDPKLELIIEGHTDNVGGDAVNLELSRKRAEAVKRWLVDKGGIGEIRLTTVGYGLTRPVADNGSEDGRAQNRRVELAKR